MAEITPGVVSVENALSILPDAERRKLTDEARAHAEAGKDARTDFGATYWDVVMAEHRRILWLDAYEKRKARLARISNAPSTNGVKK